MPLFIIKCAWCQEHLGISEHESTGGVSHGICRPCILKYFPTIAEQVVEKFAGNGERAIYQNNGKLGGLVKHLVRKN